MGHIAVIGGGASGLITAYLLSPKHHITVFEREDILGGNVRTLNGNVRTDAIRDDLKIEAGVLGFHKNSSPRLHALLGELSIELRISQPTTSLYRKKEFYPSRFSDIISGPAFVQMLKSRKYSRNLKQVRADYSSTFRRITTVSDVEGMPVSSRFGENEIMNDFIQSLLSLAFSTPFEDARDIPTGLAAPYFRTLRHPDWSYVANGVYSYLDRLIKLRGFQTETGCGPVTLTRQSDGVTVRAKGQETRFDAAVIATTPGQVLSVLSDADEAEHRLFAPWKDRKISTTVHSDLSFYKPYKSTPKTPMDLFVEHRSPLRGYNTYLNLFSGLETKTAYSFAFNLDGVIRPDTVHHKQNHIVPIYRSESLNNRPEIIERNGLNRTFYAGAWLDNGLHEGAAMSAERVSQLILRSERISD